MNESSEKLTAQRNGIYSFLFTAFAQFPPSSDVYLGVGLFLNGVVIEQGRADDIGTTSQFETYSFQSTLNLQKRHQKMKYGQRFITNQQERIYGVAITPTLVAIYQKRKSQSLKVNEYYVANK